MRRKGSFEFLQNTNDFAAASFTVLTLLKFRADVPGHLLLNLGEVERQNCLRIMMNEVKKVNIIREVKEV